MSPVCQGRVGHYLLLIAVTGLLFLPNLGGPSLWDIDEGNNLECAREMLDAGNWVIPYFNYTFRVDKPALLYWLQIWCYQLFGVGEFAGRLPSALAALVTVLLVYEMGRRFFNASTSLLAGIILASSPLFCAAAHFANPDALLNACTVATLFFFWQAFRWGRGLWFVPAGLAAGLGMLAKGPVAVVLPLGVCLLFLTWSRRLGLLWDRRLAWACLACALVFVPWYGWVGADTRGEFLRGFFLKHNVDRYLSTMEGHGGGLYYYPMALLVGLAPWSAFFVPTVWYALGRAGRTDADLPLKGDGLPPAYRFLWCWLAVYLFFFSLSGTKLPNYILPAYAPLALLTARWFDRWRCGAIQPRNWMLPAGLVLFALMGLAVAIGLAAADGSLGWLSFRNYCLPGVGNWAGLGLLPVFAAAIAWWCLRHQRRTLALAVLACSVVLLLGGLATWGVMDVDAYKAPRPLAAALHQAQQEPEIRVAGYRYFQPSLVFYCRRQVWILDREARALEHLRYPIPAYLFLPAKEWERLQPLAPAGCRRLAGHHDLYRNCEVVLVTNRPRR
jgi:4-amino-4-deoxy-L-arabinose transferase-like glycosyltransferase